MAGKIAFDIEKSKKTTPVEPPFRKVIVAGAGTFDFAKLDVWYDMEF